MAWCFFQSWGVKFERVADGRFGSYCSCDDIHSAPRREKTMEPLQEPGILQTLVLLLQTLGTLFVQLSSLWLHYLLWILWAAWWLGGVNAFKMRHVLAMGGWAPAILLILLSAIVWSRLDPQPCDCLPLPNFWWQLLYVSGLAASALFCGWLQTVLHWTPHEINLDPPAHDHGHGNDHGRAHH
jgi:hypothetical protein